MAARRRGSAACGKLDTDHPVRGRSCGAARSPPTRRRRPTGRRRRASARGRAVPAGSATTSGSPTLRAGPPRPPRPAFIGSARGPHSESTQWASAFSPDATLRSTGSDAVSVGVVDHRPGEHPTVRPGGLDAVRGEAPHVGGLAPGVRRGHGHDRQPGGEGHRLRESDRRSAADAQQRVDLVVVGCPPSPLRHLDRHVLDDLVVPPGDRARRPRCSGRPRSPGSRRSPSPARPRARRPPRRPPRQRRRGEPHPLPERLVDEPHAHVGGNPHSTLVPYISPSGSAISSIRAPSGSRKYTDTPLWIT